MKEEDLVFSFDYIREQFAAVIAEGYRSITCAEYAAQKKSGFEGNVVVNRVDIDYNIKKAKKLVDIFNELGVKASFFLRLHAEEYNPLSLENYPIVRHIIDSGHELGYHSESVDQAVAWGEDAEACFRRDIKMFQDYFGVRLQGVACHNNINGINNLDMWHEKKASDFDLLYEAYDKEPSFNLFQESFYVSDSEWTQWKCYDNGVLVKDDRRTLEEHAKCGHKVLYSLIHPDTYFDPLDRQ